MNVATVRFHAEHGKIHGPFPKGGDRLRFRGYLGNLMSHNQRDLKHHKNERQRHHAERLETDPGIGRKIAPDDLVEHSEKEKKADPTQGQNTPAFLLHLKDFAKSELQHGPAEIKASRKDDGKKQIYNRRFDLDEGVIVEIDRQEAENHDEDAGYESQDGDTLQKEAAC